MSSPESSLLLHIGYPKAASTWLQRHYFQASLGFGQVLNPLLLHRDLVLPQDQDLDIAAFAARVEADASLHHSADLVPVISSEALCGDLVRGGSNSDLIARRLATVLAGSARILLVVREQRDFIRSAYKTLVLFGAERDLGKMLTPAEGHFQLGFLDYDRVVERYEALFGPGSVCVLPYELFRHDPRAFLDAVRVHTGLRPLSDAQFAALPAREVANPGQSLAHLHVQRWRNRLAHTEESDYQGRKGSNAYDRVMERIARHKRGASVTPLDGWLERRFRQRVEAGVAGVFESSNQRLQESCQFELADFGYCL